MTAVALLRREPLPALRRLHALFRLDPVAGFTPEAARRGIAVALLAKCEAEARAADAAARRRGSASQR